MTDDDEFDVFDQSDKVETDQDLNEFILALMEEMDRDPEWGKRSLKEFLHGMLTFTDDQFDEDDEPSWNLFANILLMGFAYS